ncbi:leucine-rich repeat domain-containing protein [Treponema lecithinolyticum]
MNKLKVAVLLLCAALCVSCENPFLKGLLPQDIERNIIGQSPTVPDPEAPFVEGGVSLILSPDKLSIKVVVITADNSYVTVEGCTETKLQSGTETMLHAQGTLVIFKGKITKLSCDGNQLTALNVQGLSALQSLGCDSNQLTSLNVQSLNALKWLGCSSNQLTSLNVQGCSSLLVLNCIKNQLISLNVQGRSSLQVLDCAENRLTSLNVQGCSSLQNLFCQENRLTSLDVQGLSALKSLDCYSNQLTALNVQGCSSLKYLHCQENRLIALNVQGCSSLRDLNCWGNRLTAQVFTKLFTDLPVHLDYNGQLPTGCTLYTERTDITEGNHTDFTSPSDLQAAFNHAKNVKKWTMYKRGANGSVVL